MKAWLMAVGGIVVLVVAGLGIWKRASNGRDDGRYRTTKVERGEIAQTVRATGVVHPIRLVQVGTQVNGPISKLYVDYNDRVKEGATWWPRSIRRSTRRGLPRTRPTWPRRMPRSSRRRPDWSRRGAN
ncbi:MAG: hypothetical protein QME60_07605 [Verrucomicrobiota bacterium]|nr:hypothetical protein [Verrucomicrobiota bacterium]